MKILWLCSWYPNKLKPFEGDFIQRHAQAVSLIHEVQVIFIKKDEDGVVTKSISEEITTVANLTETIIYYNPAKTGVALIDKMISDYQYKKLYKKTLLKYISQHGKPSFIHVHIALKAGMAAVWLKKKFKIPYILSEHWSGYFPEAYYGFKDISTANRSRTKTIFKHAKKLTVVSKVLGEAIVKQFPIETFSVIPNVIDDTVFYPSEILRQGNVVFIHASSLTPEKNFEDIIQAFAIVKQKGYSFQLTVCGPVNDFLINKCVEKNIEPSIHFKGEVSQSDVAEEMRKSDALILFSRYETFGCVVIEGNACGLPAILSNLPVFKEYVIENQTGVFASSNSAESLAGTIIFFINNKESFNKKEIAEYVHANFKYETVAEKFIEVYKDISEL